MLGNVVSVLPSEPKGPSKRYILSRLFNVFHQYVDVVGSLFLSGIAIGRGAVRLEMISLDS